MRSKLSEGNVTRHNALRGRRGNLRTAAQIEREKPRILGKFLHHMTQPLTALRGTLEVALLPGNRRADLDQAIRAAINIAQSLVGDFALLKDVIESSEPLQSTKSVRWSQLVRTAVANISKTQPTNRISVSLHDSARTRVQANAGRLLKATEDSIRLGLMLVPADRQVEVTLAKKGRALILTVAQTMGDVPSKEVRRRAPEILVEEEVRVWILRRNVQGQRGIFQINAPSAGKKSLSIQMPLTKKPKRKPKNQ